MNCIGIDDEDHCNAVLTEYCSRIPFVKLLATFTDPYAAQPLLQSGKIDLVFLDFNLGKINASDFITEILENVQIIMISAELESRIKAYEMNLMGILSKPYPFERLLMVCKTAFKALNKCQQKR